MHLRRHDTIDVDDRKGWKHNGLRGVKGANVCIGDLALFGDLVAWVLNYAARGREGAIHERAILLGLGALEWEERAQHPTLWRFVTLYYIVSQTVFSSPTGGDTVADSRKNTR